MSYLTRGATVRLTVGDTTMVGKVEMGARNWSDTAVVIVPVPGSAPARYRVRADACSLVVSADWARLMTYIARGA